MRNMLVARRFRVHDNTTWPQRLPRTGERGGRIAGARLRKRPQRCIGRGAEVEFSESRRFSSMAKRKHARRRPPLRRAASGLMTLPAATYSMMNAMELLRSAICGRPRLEPARPTGSYRAGKAVNRGSFRYETVARPTVRMLPHRPRRDRSSARHRPEVPAGAAR